MQEKLSDRNLVIVRGGGDLATGTIIKLYNSGFKVLVLDIEKPSAIRRNVSFCEAMYTGQQTVEGITCFKAESVEDAERMLAEGKLCILADSEGNAISELKPVCVIDAIIAKKNLGTKIDMAPVVIGLGPGFTAGEDVHAVIETMRGHNLGRIIYSGCAVPNTGIPGKIAGFDKERVIHSPADGIMKNIKSITDTVKKGDVIAKVGDVPVIATLDGILRGLIRDGYPVTKGFKIADIDPRKEQIDNCFTVSDKARCIAGGALEALMHLMKEKDLW